MHRQMHRTGLKNILKFSSSKTQETEYQDQNREADFDIETFLFRSTDPSYKTAVDMQRYGKLFPFSVVT